LKIKQSEKKEVIHNLLNVPEKNKRGFWSREINFLNGLYKFYPCIDFWVNLKFKKKYDSLTFLKGEYGQKEIRKRFMEYSYVPKKTEEVKLSSKKFGKPYTKNKSIKTIKSFLTNE